MSAKHSPLPWKVDGDGVRAMVRADDATIVALRHRLPGDVNEANSAFIVRAVNAHDELVAALRPFASLLRHFDGRASRPTTGPIHSWASGDIDGGESEALTVEMLRAAAAALAKATGEGA
jgi:hypothetical protein